MFRILFSVYTKKNTKCFKNLFWALASDSKVWIGLYMETGSSTVKWSDGSTLTLMSWQRQQPSPRLEDKRMCVAADRKVRSSGSISESI